MQQKGVGSGNIFDSHYIPESLLGGAGGATTNQNYLSKGVMNMKKTTYVTKELHNPFDDSMKKSLEPVSNHVRFHSSQRYVDIDEQDKSVNSDE